MKVVFMGTPNFSIPALEQLITAPDIQVVGVYTKAPKEAKRGQKVLKSPIHELALLHDIPVFTPSTLKTSDQLEIFRNLKADIALIVAYGLILPKNIIESTKFGCVNIHPSLLPKYRGATPIQSALLNGDKVSGMSIIQMDEGVDSGDILLQEEYELGEGDDYPVLAEKFAHLGAKMALKAVRGVIEGSLSGVKQDDSQASLSRKIQKSDAKIDLNSNLSSILNKIRAFSDFMTAFIEFRGEKIKIYKAREVSTSELNGFPNSNQENKQRELVETGNHSSNSEVVTEKIDSNFIAFEGGLVNKDFIFKCGDGGYFQPQILQKPGKNRVAIKDFLLGFRV